MIDQIWDLIISVSLGKDYKKGSIKWPINYLLYNLSINGPIVSALIRTDREINNRARALTVLQVCSLTV